MFLSAHVNNSRGANRDITAVTNYSLYITLTHFLPSMDLFSLSVTLLTEEKTSFEIIQVGNILLEERQSR